MPVDLACIVEGDGDVEAVPIAIRKVVQEIDPSLALKIHPLRAPRTKLVTNSSAMSWPSSKGSRACARLPPS